MSESVSASIRLHLEDLMSSGLQRVKSELGHVGDATRSAGQQAQTSGGLFDGMMGSFAKAGLAVGGVLAITGAVEGLLGGLVAGNAEFERYETQFGVLLGSVDAAKERIGQLSKFAATTPFELPEVVKAGKVLETFGLQGDKSMKRFGMTTEQMLKTVGDAAAGSGARFDELALTFGKFSSGATGEAIMRMQELGLTTREELADMGVQFGKSGELITDKEQALAVVIQAVNKRFGGMMEKQSMTFEGMTSNLADWMGQTKRKLMEPVFEILKDKLNGLLTFLNAPETMAALTGFATAIASGIKDAMDFLGNVAGIARDAFGFIQDALAGNGSHLDDFNEAWFNVFGVQAPEAVQGFADAVGIALLDAKNVVTAIMQGDIGTALSTAVDAWSSFRERIITIIVDALPKLLTAFNGWARAAVDWVTTTALPQLRAALPGIAEHVMTFVTTTAGNLVTALTAFARAFWEWVGPALGPLVTELLGLLTTMLTWIGDHAEEIGAKLGEWAMQFAEVIVTVAIPRLLEALPGILLAVGGWVVTQGIPGIVKIAFNLGKGIVTGILNGIEGIRQEVGTALGTALRDAINSIDFWVGPFHVTGRGGITFTMPSFGSSGPPPAPVGTYYGEGGLTQYALGTNAVPRDGVYGLHKGEAVIPAEQNPYTGGGARDEERHTHIYLDGREIADVVGSRFIQGALERGAAL